MRARPQARFFLLSRAINLLSITLSSPFNRNELQNVAYFPLSMKTDEFELAAPLSSSRRFTAL
jgi:hypothetical protein